MTIEVMLLTRRECLFCHDAELILDRLVGEFNLRVRSVDIDLDVGRRLAAQGGFLFPPGILVDGEAFSYGRPSEKKLRRELARRALQQPDSLAAG